MPPRCYTPAGRPARACIVVKPVEARVCETIPFTETRDYVRGHVDSVYDAALFAQASSP